jgi:hypothetical protein
MRIDFYGLAIDTPFVTFHLWSPWRAAELEHRLFQAVCALPRTEAESGPDDSCVYVRDEKTWKAAIQAVARVLKGWQEEADPGSERRGWRWLLEADTDADGYDHNGEPLSLWAFMRLTLEQGGPGDGERGEDIDLHGFGVRIRGMSAIEGPGK